MDVLNVLDSVSHILMLGDHCSSGHDVVTLVVLCQTLNHHVRAPIQGLEHDRGGKSCVHHVLCPMCMRDLCDGCDVAQGQGGIGWCFTENELCVWLHGLPHILRIP